MRRRALLLLAIALVALFATAALAYGYTPVTPYANQDCLECHQVTQQAPINRVDFDTPDVPGGVDYEKCKVCHVALKDTPSPVYLTSLDHHHFDYIYCADCHDGDTAFWFPGANAYPTVPGALQLTPYGYFDSQASVQASSDTLHSVHSGLNRIETAFPSAYNCTKCHAAAACTACHDEPVEHGTHSASQYPAPVVKQADGLAATTAQLQCVNPACHSRAGVGTDAFSAPSCPSCHPSNVGTHGYETTQHTASVADTIDGGGKACGDCHQMDLYPEHQRNSSSSQASGCGACHPTPRASVGAWQKTCAEGGCHAAGSATDPHANEASAHTPLSGGAAVECLGCHDDGDLAAIHSAAVSTADASKTSCLVCHSTDAVPSTKDCTTCHFTFGDHPQSDHAAPASGTCAGTGCHSTTDSASNHTSCAQCHDNPGRVPVLPSTADCANCHVVESKPHHGAHWANPLLVDGSGPHYAYGQGSAGGTPSSDCTGCHTSNVISEHLGDVDATTGIVTREPRYSDAGVALTCATCHASLNPLVSTAIATGVTNCDACHVVHDEIPQTHTSTYVDAPQVPCAPCHDSQIDYSHNAGYTTTTPGGRTLSGCAVCHGNYEAPRGPVIQGAITAHDVSCTACHGATHPDKGGHTADSAASLGCGACHAKGQLSIDARSVHADCATCHENPSRVADIASESAECASCHSNEGSDYHRGLPAKHVYSGMAGTCMSANCHPSNVLPDAHDEFLAGQNTYATTCELCHQNQDVDRIPTDATAACSSCHTVHPNPDHTAADSQVCVDCHETTDALSLHASAAGGPCDVCHANPGRVPTLPTSTDCVNCHSAATPPDTNHYEAPAHTATEGTEFGYSCSACHNLGMKPEHTKVSSGAVSCVDCHEGKVDSLAGDWGSACTACHSVRHTDTTAKHTSSSPECAGSGCHAVGDVAPLHSAATTTVAGVTYSACRVCHQNSGAVPTTTKCTGCHSGHGDLTVAHTAVSSSACTACHETGDVRAVHAGSTQGECAVCHDNAVQVPTLPGTVECVTCHAADSPVDPNHYAPAAHTAADGAQAPGVPCSQCHSLGMKTEHAKASSGPVTCVQCHEANVDSFTSVWDDTCARCHATKHAAMTQDHTSTKTACGGAGCHNIANVADIHDGLPNFGCDSCHAGREALPTTTDCGSAGCHPNTTGDHEAQHDTATFADPGCYGCHFQYLTDEHAALGYTCATCHSSTNSAVVAAISGGNRACDACHPAVNGKDYHAPQNNTEFVAGNASMHRVSAELPGMRSSFKVGASTYTWSLPSASSFLKTGWATDSVVTCRQCHTYSGSTGPHGATMKVNIDPAYPKSYNTVGGSNNTAQLSGSSPTGMSMTDNGSAAAGIICEKCHDLRGSSFSNVVHAEHDDRGSEGAYCTHCHAAIPHGMGRPRLLAYTTDPAPYKTTNGGLQRITLKNYSPNGWSKSDCGAGCSSSRHPLSGTSWPSTVVTVGNLTGTVTGTGGLPLAGATVTTDKGQTGTTDALGKFTFSGVSTGTYSVTAAKAGYTSQTKSATVANNQTTSVNFALVAIQPGTLAGTVTNAAGGAALSGVTVQVTGDGSATTPADGTYSLSLTPGTYTITYGLAGFTSQTKSVVITSNTTTTQNVALAAIPPQPVNLALNKTGTSSSQYSSSYSAAKAVDGSTSTYWRSSSSGTQWLRVDLGAAQSIKRFVINWNGSYYARSYRVETSSDGTNWTSQFSQSSSSTGDRTITLTSAVSARYVRVYCTSAAQYNYQMTELEVWDQ